MGKTLAAMIATALLLVSAANLAGCAGPVTTSTLHGVWGASSTDVFAVGTGGTVLHYDGAAWSAMSSGTYSHLYGIWISATADIFAVGESGTMITIDRPPGAEIPIV